jgi:hypothetical protein
MVQFRRLLLANKSARKKAFCHGTVGRVAQRRLRPQPLLGTCRQKSCFLIGRGAGQLRRVERLECAEARLSQWPGFSMSGLLAAAGAAANSYR